MRLALEVWSADVDQVLATCSLAESLGIDAFYYGESPHDLNLDCWTTLAALAMSTEQIRLGPVIANVLPGYRSTALLVKQATTVDAISAGRLDLRTGVGADAAFARPWWEPIGVEYPSYDNRLQDLRHALGELDRRSPHLPVTVAARAPRAMRVAADHADVWETSFCTPSEYTAVSDQFALLTAGRPIVKSLEIDGFVSSRAAGVDRVLAGLRRDRGRDEDVARILERALVGQPAEIADHIGRLAAVGVDQLLVALHDPHDADAIAALAEGRARHEERRTPRTC